MALPCNIILRHCCPGDHYSSGVLYLHFSQQHVPVLCELNIWTHTWVLEVELAH